METVLCAGVGTARCQHGLEACSVYDRYGAVLKKNDTAVQNMSALTGRHRLLMFLFDVTKYIFVCHYLWDVVFE
jgi:hypothetical protein